MYATLVSRQSRFFFGRVFLFWGFISKRLQSKFVERLTYDLPVAGASSVVCFVMFFVSRSQESVLTFSESIFDIARFERVFMHQYRLLMTPTELLSMLEQRFDVRALFGHLTMSCEINDDDNARFHRWQMRTKTTHRNIDYYDNCQCK